MSAARRKGRPTLKDAALFLPERKTQTQLSSENTLPESGTQRTATRVDASTPTPAEFAPIALAAHWFSAIDEAPQPRPASAFMRKVDDRYATMADLMEERFARDDYDGALVLASTIVYARPDHTRALLIKRACSDLLKHKSTAQLASPMSIPQRAVSWEELSKFTLSREEIFMLTFIDGTVPLDTVFDMTGASPEIAYSAFRRLLSLELIVLREPVRKTRSE